MTLIIKDDAHYQDHLNVTLPKQAQSGIYVQFYKTEDKKEPPRRTRPSSFDLMVCAKPLHPQCFLNSCLYLVGFEFGEGSVAQPIEGVQQPTLGSLLHRHALSCRSNGPCETCPEGHQTPANRCSPPRGGGKTLASPSSFYAPSRSRRRIDHALGRSALRVRRSRVYSDS
jgi:hypothetical protein